MSKSVFSTIKVLFLSLVISLSVNSVKGQDDMNKTQGTTTKETIKKRERFDISFHLLVTTEKQTSDEKLPPSLEGVAKQLRSSLNLKNVNVMDSFLYRADEKSSVEAKGLTNTKTLQTLPSNVIQREFSLFYEVSFVTSELFKDDFGRSQIKLDRLRFGMRYPVVSASVINNGVSTPIINYEPIGLTLSSLSLNENEPTVVGTLSVGSDNGTLAIVVTVNRVASR